MIKEMVSAVNRQEEAVQKAMTQSSAILRAGHDVQAMASATRLLSLNARVEASRLGDQGSSFSVIADEMRQLSHAVQQTNSAVARMAKELERLLPQISEQTRSIHGQFERFSRHVEVQLQGLRGRTDSGDETEPVVNEIVAAAQEALSHLAFQDPMVQSLGRIQRSVDVLESRVLSQDELPVAPAASADTPRAAEPEPQVDIEAGDVMLF